MSKLDFDLHPIREKLRQQARQYPPPNGEDLVDWSPPTVPRPAGSKPGAGPSQGAQQLASAVRTLQQRSPQPYVMKPSSSHFSPGAIVSSTATPNQGSASSSVPSSNIHVQRLQTLIQQINHLSQQQEQLLLQMKDSFDGWQRDYQHAVATGTGSDMNPPPRLDIEAAVVALAAQDQEGDIVLRHRAVDFYQTEREATDLADSLRSRSRHRRRSKTTPVQRSRRQTVDFEAGWRALLAEPLKMLSQLSAWLVEPIVDGLETLSTPSSASSPQSRRQDSLTWVNGLLWLGGGIVGRQGLNLALIAFPGMWSIAVMAVTGMTAYALYRATLSPRPDFGLAIRVLLVVVGLIIGGQF